MNQDEQCEPDYVFVSGGWTGLLASARVGTRHWAPPHVSDEDIGFRLVRHRSALERLVDEIREVPDEEG